MKGRGGGIRARKPIEIEVKDIYWQKVTFPCEIIPILCRFQRVVALPPFCFTVKASQGFELEVGRNRERGRALSSSLYLSPSLLCNPSEKKEWE